MSRSRSELARYLHSLQARFDSREALRRQEAMIHAAWELALREGPRINELLTPLQLQMLPGNVEVSAQLSHTGAGASVSELMWPEVLSAQVETSRPVESELNA